MSNSRNDDSTDNQREAIKGRYDLCDAAYDAHVETVSSWVEQGYEVEETRMEPIFGRGVETLLVGEDGDVISVETANKSVDAMFVGVYDVTREFDPIEIATHADYEAVLASEGDAL